MLENTIVGYVVACRLANPSVPFATEAENVTVAKLLAHLFGCSMNVITVLSNWTGRKNSYGFRMKEVIGLLNSLFQLFFTTKDNILFLHVS